MWLLGIMEELGLKQVRVRWPLPWPQRITAGLLVSHVAYVHQPSSMPSRNVSTSVWAATLTARSGAKQAAARIASYYLVERASSRKFATQVWCLSAVPKIDRSFRCRVQGQWCRFLSSSYSSCRLRLAAGRRASTRMSTGWRWTRAMLNIVGGALSLAWGRAPTLVATQWVCASPLARTWPVHHSPSLH